MIIFILSFSFVASLMYASDDLTEILIPESLLGNFEEREEIESLGAEIAYMANCFEENGFHAEVLGVDFSKTYCVFVKANILEKMPGTTEKLDKLLGSACRVWNIPFHVNGKTMLVQINRALELSEMELDNCTEGEIPKQGIKQILSAKKYGAISLERAVSYTSDEQTQKRKALNAKTLTSSVGEDDNQVILQENQIYSFDEFEKVVAQNSEGSSMDIGALLFGNKEPGIAVIYYIIGGAVLGIIIVISIIFYKYLKDKR